jgi:Aspartate/ornithine carbamoyltransferase, Asp/Orn binding domain
MHEASGKPYGTIAYALTGDCRFNMGRSLPVMGALMAAGADFIHTDVWVSTGEARDVWTDRVKLLTPYQVNAALLKASGNPAVRFMHCLPACHDPNTTVGREIMEHTGMTSGLEVTGEVFDSGASGFGCSGILVLVLDDPLLGGRIVSVGKDALVVQLRELAQLRYPRRVIIGTRGRGLGRVGGGDGRGGYGGRRGCRSRGGGDETLLTCGIDSEPTPEPLDLR